MKGEAHFQSEWEALGDRIAAKPSLVVRGRKKPRFGGS